MTRLAHATPASTLALAILLLPACGDKDGDAGAEYDLETWRSPLASQYDGEGDPAQGEDIYYNETWTDSTGYAFTCDNCHSANPDDTWTTDGDDWNRPAHTTWNAALRETWKINHGHDKADSDKIGAFGGQICIKAYWPSGAEMTPEQAAHLEAWMKTNIDSPDTDAETAQPLDYGFNSWETQEDFVASVQDGSGGWLYGSELGDVAAGEELAARHCGSCHTAEGEDGPVFYTAGTAELGELISRIRRVDLDGGGSPNDRMPRVPFDRLPDGELGDLLAFLTEGREGE